MDDSHNHKKNFLMNGFYQKWLVLVNTALVLLLFVSVILAGSAWFSDRMMIGVINNVIGPRLNRLIQKNPDILYDLTKTLTTESVAPMFNRLLEKDPQWLSRSVQSIDPALFAGSLNNVFKKNPESISLVLKYLDAKAMAELKNHLLNHNKPFIITLLTTLDHRMVGEILIETVSQDPLLISKVLEGFQPVPLSRAVNKTLQGRRVFLSNFIGTLDMGSLATIIDKVAKEHPEFMNELVDKIVELIRKDFMKSGI